MVRLTDRPDMSLDVYRGRKTTKQTTVPMTDHDVFMQKYGKLSQNNLDTPYLELCKLLVCKQCCSTWRRNDIESNM